MWFEEYCDQAQTQAGACLVYSLNLFLRHNSCSRLNSGKYVVIFQVLPPERQCMWLCACFPFCFKNRKLWIFSRFASYKAVDGVTWRQPLQIWQYWLLLVGFQILTAMATFQILTAIGWFSNTDNCYGWFSIKIIKSSKWSAPGFHIFFCKSTLQESWR